MQELGLSDKHTEEVRLFMRFFRNKRETALRLLETEFEDTRSDSLVEDMYSRHDVEDIIDGLKKVIRENFRAELSKDLNMTVLLFKQLFQEADRQGMELSMDIAQVEDQALLEEVERLRLDNTLKSPVKAAPKLVSIKDEHNRLVSEAAKAEESTKAIQDRFQRLQQQCSEILKEKATLADQLEAARDRLSQMEGSRREQEEAKGEIVMTTNQLRTEVERLRLDLQKAQIKVGDLESENSRRLNESKQFQQLKKLMSNKNDTILDLRKKLSRYEPDENVKQADDDDDL